jgi:hypothetical protein
MITPATFFGNDSQSSFRHLSYTMYTVFKTWAEAYDAGIILSALNELEHFSKHADLE